MQNLPRRAVLSAALLAHAASAQPAWPARDVRFVVPFPPGGTTDILARQLAEVLRTESGHAVAVENVPGAGGTLGAARAARMPADGTTLFMGAISTHAIAPALYPRLEYGPERDFAAVALLVSMPNVLVANPTKIGGRGFAAWLADARGNPGKYTVASAGNGTSTHLSIALLAMQAGVELTHVPYRGGAPALQAVLGGEVDLFMDGISSVLPQLPGGALVPLAVTGRSRAAVLPDVPAMAEAPGLEGFEAVAWIGLHTPSATPPATVAAMNAAVNRVLLGTALGRSLEARGNQVPGGDAASYAGLVHGEIEKWGRVVRALNLRPD